MTRLAQRPRRLALALALLGAGALLLAAEERIRFLEAAASSTLVSGVGALHAWRIGTAVVFPVHGRAIGYTLTAGCTASLLAAPFFFLVSGAIVISPRIPLSRALASLAWITLVVFAVNQLRLGVIAASLRGLGFQRGYEMSHVLLGTVVSTIGLVTGVVIFLVRIVGERADEELAGGDPA